MPEKEKESDEEDVCLNDAHQPVTKDLLRSWLVKFGIPTDRIYEPSQVEIDDAADEIRPLLQNMLIVPYKLKFTDEDVQEPIIFEVKITFLKRWINIKLMLLKHTEVPKRLKLPLYEKMLQANFDLNEVTYSISGAGDVYVEADMPIETSYFNFESEYGSIEFAVDHFLTEVLPDIAEISAKDTFNPALYT